MEEIQKLRNFKKPCNEWKQNSWRGGKGKQMG